MHKLNKKLSTSLSRVTLGQKILLRQKIVAMLRLFLVSCFGLFASGCGFHLKSDTVQTSLSNTTVSIVSPDFLLLGRVELERQLEMAGANLSIADPDLTVHLLEENVRRRALTRDENGRPTEFELRLVLNYSIALSHADEKESTAEKKPVASERNLSNQRYSIVRTGIFIYNNRLLLAAEAREREIIKQLREELISDLIQHISQLVKA